jgi:hypothetical protein
LLTLIEGRLADAAAGAGRVPFVAGEAGIGKTRLLGSIARHARATSFTIVRAAAFPGDVQWVAGLLLDLASDLMSVTEPAWATWGRVSRRGYVRSSLTQVTRITSAAC